MNNLRDVLGCGTIAVGENTGVVIIVRKLSDITQILVPLFKNNKLHGTKRLDFEDFCRVCDLMNNKEHLNPIGLEKIREIKKGMNTGRPIDS
jgi:hypothetical protein